MASLKGLGLLSTGQVIKILEITKVTLEKWRKDGKIKAIPVNIGTRIYWGFTAEEVKRIKAKMKGKREAGKPLLK